MPRNQRDESVIIKVPGGSGGDGLVIDNSMFTANGTNSVTISNCAPGAVGTATINSWLTLKLGGTKVFIPCWT